MTRALQRTPPAPDGLAFAPPQARELIEPLEEVVRRLSPSPIEGLDEVALQLRTLPYGAFTEFAQAIGADSGKVWRWAVDRKIRL